MDVRNNRSELAIANIKNDEISLGDIVHGLFGRTMFFH